MPGDPQIGKKFNLFTERRDLRKLCPNSADFLRHMASLDGWSPRCAERWIEAAEAIEMLLAACKNVTGMGIVARLGIGEGTVEKLKAAIAKVEGKEVPRE